jgi:hypothetical protein
MNRSEKIKEMVDFYMSVSGIDYTKYFKDMDNTSINQYYICIYELDRQLSDGI